MTKPIEPCTPINPIITPVCILRFMYAIEIVGFCVDFLLWVELGGAGRGVCLLLLGIV